MSKNIIIQEGGSPKQLTAAKLKTALAAGGSCLWVPEDETQLTAKHITENGTYYASSDEKYGYEYVTVNVAGGSGSGPGGPGSSVIGTDADGEESLVSVDEGGSLVTTKLPASIRITTPPTAHDYVVGDPVDYTGMVVKAYKKDGTLWTSNDYPDGVIPAAELELPVTTADLSDMGEYHSGEIIWACRMDCIGPTMGGPSQWIARTKYRWYYKPNNGVAVSAFVFNTRDQFGRGNWCGPILLSPIPSAAIYAYGDSEQGINHSTIYQGAVFYYSNLGWLTATDGLLEESYTQLRIDFQGAALDPNDILERAGVQVLSTDEDDPTEDMIGVQEIPVKWNRVGDSKLLETSFRISVTEAEEEPT